MFSSDIDRTIKATRALEHLLVSNYGARGRGLHALVSSVEGQLPAKTVRKLRWVATLRNKVIHEEGFTLRDPRGFSKEVKRLKAELAKPQCRFASPRTALTVAVMALVVSWLFSRGA